jgi:glycosyltransferase involved in cell wall biosynthesis
MNTCKVLHMLPWLSTGGAETVTVNLLSALAGRCEVHLISMFPPQGFPLEDAARKAGIEVHYLRKKLGMDPFVTAGIASVLAKVKPDIIHTHLYTLPYCLPIVWKSWRTRWFHTIHSMAARDGSGVHSHLNGLAFRLGVRPVAISAGLQADVQRTYGTGRVAMVPNGIPTQRFQHSEEARITVRESLQVRPGEVLLIAIGSLWPVKNHADLIRAMAGLSMTHPNVKLILAGVGILQDELVRLRDELILGDSVKFLGVRQDVADLLSGADVFVMPSLAEGNPLSLMEAMASGLPVVASAVGGIPDLIDDGVNGYLVKPRDVDQLSEAIGRLAADEDLRRGIGARNSEKAAREFDIGLMADRYWELYLK